MCHSPPCTQAAQTTHGLAPTAHRWDGGNNNKGQPGPDTPQRIRPRRAKLQIRCRGQEQRSHFNESEQSILGKRRLYTYCIERVMQQAVRHRIRARSKRLLDLAGSIGHDARDNDETALRKRVAVLLFSGTLPLTIAWSAIYLAVGASLAAAVPGFYSAITPINTVIFAHTRNLVIYRFTQLLLVLILPWLVMISLLAPLAPGHQELKASAAFAQPAQAKSLGGLAIATSFERHDSLPLRATHRMAADSAPPHSRDG